MSDLATEVKHFIEERLFTQVKPVIFSDLIGKFKIGPSSAKRTMYQYYKDNTNSKYNCVIICCYENGSIKVINDLNNIEDQNSILDCFIYAFNPMDEFIPTNTIINNYENLLIKNPYKLHDIPISSESKESGPIRSKTEDNAVTDRTSSSAINSHFGRARTIPESTSKNGEAENNVVESVKQKKKKDMGLRSTALLAKMRQEREEKEAERQNELNKRRQEQQDKLNNDPKRKSQMDELNKLFVDDDEEEEEQITNKKEDIDTLSNRKGLVKEENIKALKEKELEELLDTTAEESLLEISKGALESPSKLTTSPTNVTEHSSPHTKPEEKATSYVDEDGYIVTKKPVPATPVKTPTTATKRKLGTSSLSSSKSGPPSKKKQGSIESFFKRK